MTENEFKEALKKINISYTQDMIYKLDEYCKFLIEYNRHTNLTAIREKEDIYLKHFYDSITLSKAIDLSKINTLIDIGSGAGFPGVVIKIFFPNIKVTILDSNNKKTAFIKEVIKKLELKDINVICDRAENFALSNTKFDLVTSRAVAYVDIITTLSSYFVNENGYIVLMKGDFSEEEQILKNYKKELHVDNYEIINVNLDKNNVRNLVKIKIVKSPQKILNYSQIIKRHQKWVSK